MNRRLSKANSITTYDTATLWRALEASSANQQNPTTRRWQRAASRLLRQHTITTMSPQQDHPSSSPLGTNIGLAGNVTSIPVLKSFCFDDLFNSLSSNQLQDQ